MKLAGALTIKEIDRVSMEKYGITGLQLMENAGRGVAEVIARETGSIHCKAPKVVIFAGKGNNGGDGFVAARHLYNQGIRSEVYLLCRIDELKGDAAANAATWQKMGGAIFTVLSEEDIKRYEPSIRHASIIVDAIFGTGLSSPVTGTAAVLIDLINGFGKKVVAVDIPSGVDASTGRVLGAAVKADITATMALPKIGLYNYPGRPYAGKIEIIDIGAPAGLVRDEKIRWNLLCDEDMRRFLKFREPGSHKSSHGHLLVLAGSVGKTGAAYMAAVGAMRAGAGLTTIALPKSLNAIMEVKTTEVMTEGLPEEVGMLCESSFDEASKIIENKTALVVGPGLGNSQSVFNLVHRVVREVEKPMVIDADGLNAFINRLEALKIGKHHMVLTPHPGEAARLLKTATAQVQDDRLGSALRLAEATESVVVLKGAGTVIATPEGEFFINPTGNPGMSTAGTGDVLAGMIGGLLAQGYTATEAACAGVYIHGMAGDMARDELGETGMMATDLLPKIPVILNSFTG